MTWRVCWLAWSYCVQLDWGGKDDACYSAVTPGDGPDVGVAEWHHIGCTISGGIDTEGSAITYVDGQWLAAWKPYPPPPPSQHRV